MSAGDDFFAPPPFKPDEALITLRRQLRDLRPLAERAVDGKPRFELKGRRVVELAVEAGAINARLVKRPAMSPEWERFTLNNGADVRKFVDETRKRLARWTDED